MSNFNFTDRNSYKAWVAAWKLDYRETSQLIRDTKTAMKIAAREGDSKAESLQAQREYLRAKQRRAITLRQDGKVEVQRQYLASRETEQQAA